MMHGQKSIKLLVTSYECESLNS